MDLWGRTFSRRQLEGYVGDMRQIADIRLATLDDGPERGVRVADIRTGSGLDFTVLLDRGLDIGTASYNGIAVAWQSGSGPAHPARHEPEGAGWLRTFHGGLLTLCGMSHVGPGMIDPENGETLGLHGRVSHIPAHDVRIERLWTADDQWRLRLHGVIDEASIFGSKLHLERSIEITPGEPVITLQDTVRNSGGEAAPLMMLYHCNFGWPLVSPESELISPAQSISARDAAAEAGISEWNKMSEPTPAYAEQVFYHTLAPDSDTSTSQSAALLNRPLGLGMEVRFDSATLTQLTEWKQMGYGDYVLGIEPGNCVPEGRVAARANHRLTMLAPGETKTFTLGFRMLTSRREVDAFRENSKHRLLHGVGDDS